MNVSAHDMHEMLHREKRRARDAAPEHSSAKRTPTLADASMPVLGRGRVVRFPRERLLAWLERQEPRSARRSAQAQHKSSAA